MIQTTFGYTTLVLALVTQTVMALFLVQEQEQVYLQDCIIRLVHTCILHCIHFLLCLYPYVFLINYLVLLIQSSPKNWEGGTYECLNDGNQPAYMTNSQNMYMHATLQSCCDFNYSWTLNTCLAGNWAPATGTSWWCIYWDIGSKECGECEDLFLSILVLAIIYSYAFFLLSSATLHFRNWFIWWSWRFWGFAL